MESEIPNSEPRSRGFLLFGFSPSRRHWLKPNSEKTRERALSEYRAVGQPAVNGGPTPLRGKPHEWGLGVEFVLEWCLDPRRTPGACAPG